MSAIILSSCSIGETASIVAHDTEKRTALQCAARGCSGCSVCDPKELHESRECFDCGQQFVPPPYKGMENNRCCEACAQYA